MPIRLRSVLGYGRATSLVMLSSCAMLLFSTRGFYVYGSCMEPNLRTGERVLASRVPYIFGGPERGDVVIFKYPADPSKNYVKRVVGLPGDLVEIHHGRLFVNGALQREPYIQLPSHGNFGPERIKGGRLFVLGDNRDHSNDSRFWGELPIKNVEAKAIFRYWPPNRWNLMP